MVHYLNRPRPGKTKLVFCACYRHKWTGKLMVAKDYGLKAWAFYVSDEDVG